MKRGFGWEGQIKNMRIIGGGLMGANGSSPSGLTNSRTISLHGVGESRGEHCLQIWKTGWNDNSCGDQIRFVCSQQICPLNDPSNETINNENNQETNKTNASNKKSDPPIIEVATICGVFLIIIVVVIIICVMRKSSKKNQEVMKTDENQVYGVYQLSDTYERQYSTSEAVDYNDYYGK